MRPCLKADLHSALALVTDPAQLRVPAGCSRLADDAIAHARHWSRIKAVRGFGVGSHHADGCLNVYVDACRSLDEPDISVPNFVQLPWSSVRVPVIVRPIGKLCLTSGLDGIFRPAIPGCAISTPGRNSGTFGCVVRDRAPGSGFYVLSAAHVIANHTFDPLGLPVLQPGGLSGVDQVIGVVARWGSIEFTANTFPNLFDAAIARIDPATVRPDIFGIGRPTGLNMNVGEGTPVRKCGAATGVLAGVVEDANFHCSFHYRDPNGNAHRAGFQQQFLCSKFSAGGDSGAAVLDTSNRVVGLIIGRAGENTVVSPIGPVLAALNVVLA